MSLHQRGTVRVSAKGEKTEALSSLYRSFTRPSQQTLLGYWGWLILTIIIVSFWNLAPASAMDWFESRVDPGIGFLGLRREEKAFGWGLRPKSEQYSPEMQATISRLVLRRQPYETHPVVGRFTFVKEGGLAIETDDGLYPLVQQGVPLKEGQYALIVKKRQGHWVEVTIRHAPRLTGWLKLTEQGPFRFWLWYSYIDSLVRSRTPLMFITPLHDDFLYQANPRSLAMLKNVFQLEDAVLIPERLDGPYMLVKAKQAQRYQNTSTKTAPPFERIEPHRVWVRWLQDNGRPKVFPYHQGVCGRSE